MPAAGAHQAGGGLPEAGVHPAGLRHRRAAGEHLPAQWGRPACGVGCATAAAAAPARPQVVSLDSVPIEVRQAAAVNFKNYIKYHWVRGAGRVHRFQSAPQRPRGRCALRWPRWWQQRRAPAWVMPRVAVPHNWMTLLRGALPQVYRESFDLGESQAFSIADGEKARRGGGAREAGRGQAQRGA